MMNPVLYSQVPAPDHESVPVWVAVSILALVLVVGVATAIASVFFRSQRAKGLMTLAGVTGALLIALVAMAGVSVAFTGLGLLALLAVVVGGMQINNSFSKADQPSAGSGQKPGDMRREKDLRPQTAVRLCPECGTVLADDGPEGLCPRCLLHSGLGSAFPSPPENDAHTGAYHGPFIPPAPAELARYFPQMEIIALLGQGGMGAVYKARQVKLDRLVALKILPPEWGKDPAFAERFSREARALAKLSHPHIVAVHDFGEAEGLYYFVMEYVDGANLRQVLQNGHLPPDEALRIVPQLCEALQYAHEEGVVHRDIKPENILLDRRGRVKVADFGLAKLVGPTPGHFTLTGSRQVVGTPHYMAPEQMEKPHTVDHRADIYSLGVVLYEMLTGELPLGRFAVPSQKAAVDARLDEVVLRALAKEPAERYQRISEIQTDLESAVTGQKLAPAAGPTAEGGEVADELRGLVLSYFHTGETFSTGVYGRLRCDGRALVLEMEIHKIKPGFFSNDVLKTWKQKNIALNDIQVLRVENGWLGPRIILQTSCLGTLADIPGATNGRLKLHLGRKDRPSAKRFVAAVWRRAGWEKPAPPRRSGGALWQPTDLDDRRERVQQLVDGPARGLLLTGWLTLVFGVLGGSFILIDWHRHVFIPHPIWKLLTLVGLGALLGVTALLVVGGLRMLQQRSHTLAVAASVWAVLPWPFGFLITVPSEYDRLSKFSIIMAVVLPLVVWILGTLLGWRALRVLLRPEVRDAFAGQLQTRREPVPPTGFLRRKMHSLVQAAHFWVVDSVAASRASVSTESPTAAQPQSGVREQPTQAARAPSFRGVHVLWVAGFTVALLAGGAVVWTATSGTSHSRSAIPIPTRPLTPLPTEPPASEGPYPVPITAGRFPSMNLQPAQIESLNRIRQDAHREYLALERKHTQRQVVEPDQRVKVTVEPFPRELEGLENRVWKQVDQVLNVQQQAQARKDLWIVGDVLAFGKHKVDIEIWRKGEWFHWKVKSVGPEDTGTAPKLPAWHRRFWEEPTEEAENSKPDRVP